MTYTIIDGTKIATALKQQVISAATTEDRSIGLATVLIGHDDAASLYQRRLSRLATELGVPHRAVHLAEHTSTDAVVGAIDRLNRDQQVSGILVLRPLPAQVDEAQVFAALAPVKDIEAVHPDNAGLLALGAPRYLPSTAAAAFHVLDTWIEQTGEDPASFYHRSHLVVVGRSNNVGKPVVSLAYARGAAVTSIDVWASRAGRLGWYTRRADVLIVAAGVPGLIRAEHVRSGAVVLDVGVNVTRDPDTGIARLVGDVDFAEVAPRTLAITPVPGGIGPVTDVWLLRNTIQAADNLAATGSAPAPAPAPVPAPGPLRVPQPGANR